jgi:hypothetical protein
VDYACVFWEQDDQYDSKFLIWIANDSRTTRWHTLEPSANQALPEFSAGHGPWCVGTDSSHHYIYMRTWMSRFVLKYWPPNTGVK